MNQIKDFFTNIAKAIAKFYNSLPSQLKIAIMVSTSILFATWLSALVGYLQSLTGLNAFTGPLVQWVISILTVVINLLQQYAVQKGTEALAKEGDAPTIAMLQTKAAANQALADKGSSL